jgi:hypothetical protein
MVGLSTFQSLTRSGSPPNVRVFVTYGFSIPHLANHNQLSLTIQAANGDLFNIGSNR